MTRERVAKIVDANTRKLCNAANLRPESLDVLERLAGPVAGKQVVPRGVPLAPVRLPEPPTLRMVSPLDRVVEGNGAVTIEALAEDFLGLADVAFEVERDGRMLDASLGRESTTITDGHKSARLVLTVTRLEDEAETTIRICAVARSGVLSLPAMVTVRW